MLNTAKVVSRTNLFDLAEVMVLFSFFIVYLVLFIHIYICHNNYANL